MDLSPLHGRQLHVPSIDVFITFRCGLRCSYCFVGDNLKSNRDMDVSSVHNLLRQAHSWGTKQITFLGGEPTLHPRFTELLTAAVDEGYDARIVTNGHASYQRFLARNKKLSPVVCFSLDGATPETHDGIRGDGSFAMLLESIKRTRSAGHRMGAIVAIGRRNADDAANIIKLCQDLEFEYVNVHYVSNRGFAKPEDVLSVDEWHDTGVAIRAAIVGRRPAFRVENTFVEEKTAAFRCAVSDRTNLMFLPDGRVYMCMLFIDIPNSHSYIWNGEKLQSNSSDSREDVIVHRRIGPGCAAMALVNPAIASLASAKGKIVQCIYEKECINETVTAEVKSFDGKLGLASIGLLEK